MAKNPGDRRNGALPFPPGPSPGPSPGRLPSFKKKRDLSLGEGKKKFVPNLNFQRVKSTTTKPSSEAKESEGQSKSRTPRGDNARDSKSRGRARPEIIQTMGSVFGDGLSLEGKRRGGGGGGRISIKADPDGVSSSAAFPRQNQSKRDREEEERRRKALLRDDFVEDAAAAEGLFVPVQLPMTDTGKVFEGKEEEDGFPKGLIRKKKANRILDSDDEDKEVAVEAKSSEKSVIAPDTSELMQSTVFHDLISRQRGDLFFIQLPDHLPGSVPVKKEAEEPVDGEETTTSKKPTCLLADLPEGFMGKIEVRRSGRTQLKIGQNRFDIELGTQVGFLQDLVSVETSQGVGDMTVLGHVKHRLIVTPDWDELLQDNPESDSLEPGKDADIT